MTDYHFTTPEPVALYVEIGAGQVDVTATDTGESRVELTGRHADEVVVELDGRDLRVVAPRRKTGFFSSDDDALFATITSLPAATSPSGPAAPTSASSARSAPAA